MTFAARISFFIADMLEDDEVTATYKSSRYKMPCHTCMISQSDLNNINIVLENILFRIPENMQEIIQNGQEKIFQCILPKMLSGDFRNYHYLKSVKISRR